MVTIGIAAPIEVLHNNNSNNIYHRLFPCQHLQTKKSGQTLNYILSGCANFIDASEAHKGSVPGGSSLFHWADLTKLGGFVYAEASPTNMTITYLEASGKILFKTTVLPRKR